MNQGDTIQIEAPDFDPDIDISPSTEENCNELKTQGTLSSTPKVAEPEDDSLAPAMTVQQIASQETDWPDAIPVQIPWVSSSSSTQKNRKLSKAKPDITPKVLKFWNWRTILKKSSLPIWTHTWHTPTHMKLAHIFIKNTDPACTP